MLLPTRSRNHAYTVFTPSPEARLQTLLVAKGPQAEHDEALLMHISATPLASVAASERVTVVVLVNAAVPLMATVPPGASVSTVT